MTTGREKERQRLPFRVDPFRFAHDAVELESSLPLAQMKRLSAMLYQSEGVVTVRLAFAVDILGVCSLQGRLQTRLDLVCQRCLEPMPVDVDTKLALGFARSDAGVEQIPSGLDPIRVEGGQVDLLQLLEDEIMLALPQIPRHSENECQASTPESNMADESTGSKSRSQERDNPFSVLAGLKKSE